ncbi:MAG: tRNA (guanosine(46)-N7)-methyltransferase TrmB [Pseudomonadales bacterium]|nr:tRNA (guanosine(46)-N7)-methyltransferase TrmB [Pseudomonadales bacterium]MBO6596692.1 tRNA (guanosine(46)-N7)-methyltransferase TrmB [Pseudomonadales bacterium]MBO6655993.1 tRNA (guanosine(46)-N7)-methyltransferase TrmB [Pseudomonadales bacterium]MBO6823319.1 tRNA (guanosine(46)-N7)-methyltransferase TrmB [Pseudomonadales bacterium]
MVCKKSVDLTLNERRIRSFVLRQGRLTPGQEKALEEVWPEFGCQLSDGVQNFAERFGNNNPVHLEVGFGMGDSLATQAAENPQLNYLGVEVHRPGVGHLLMLLRENSLHNVRVFSEDSIEVLNQCIPDGSLARVQIFFPDPWPKKRHHKRRIIQADFVSLLKKKLVSGGMIHFATDWVPYAEDVETLFSHLEGFSPAEAPPRPETKFERRGLKLGHEIRDLAYLSVDEQ